MDLRVQKTTENIEAAFFDLLGAQPLNKIKINALCEKSKINKSTFYRHYADIYSLSEKVENDLVNKIMRRFTAIDSLFTAPEEFIHGILAAIQAEEKKVQLLFKDRVNIFADKIEARLKAHYLPAKYSPNEDIIMSFLVGGATHVFLNPKYDYETYTKTVAVFLKQMPRRMRQR